MASHPDESNEGIGTDLTPMMQVLKPSPTADEPLVTGVPNRPKTLESVSLSLHPTWAVTGQDGIIVKVSPPKQPEGPHLQHTPCDIVLVIDVSGSMSVDAPVPQQEGGAVESFGLSVLDLVKHAAHTICSTLNEGDRLGIVTFSDDSKVSKAHRHFSLVVVSGTTPGAQKLTCPLQKLFDLTVMSDENKDWVKDKINSMQPDGVTNMWHGIKDGLKMLDDVWDNMHVPTVMVLTDGMPNHM
jgi:hypothetical protein